MCICVWQDILALNKPWIGLHGRILTCIHAILHYTFQSIFSDGDCWCFGRILDCKITFIKKHSPSFGLACLSRHRVTYWRGKEVWMLLHIKLPSSCCVLYPVERECAVVTPHETPVPWLVHDALLVSRREGELKVEPEWVVQQSLTGHLHAHVLQIRICCNHRLEIAERKPKIYTFEPLYQTCLLAFSWSHRNAADCSNSAQRNIAREASNRSIIYLPR